MSEKDIDALVASTNFNVFYTSDVYPFSQSYTLLPLEKSIDPVLITSIYGTTPVVLMSPPWFSDVRYYGEFYIETNFAQEPLGEEERLQIFAHKCARKSVSV